MANDCLWRDATRLYKDRPVASVKKQILAACVFFLLDAIVQNLLFPESTKDSKSEFKEFKREGVSPRDLRNEMCFDRPAMTGDVFQEVLFRLLAFKYLVVGAKMNLHVANLLQAVLFGFFHMWNVVFQEKSKAESLQQSASAMIYFLLMGYFFAATNNIFACVIFHIFTNQKNCLDTVADYAKFLKK